MHVDKYIKSFIVNGFIMLSLMILVCVIRFINTEKRLRRTEELGGSGRRAGSPPLLYASEKGALFCQVSWILAGCVILAVNIATECEFQNGFSYRMTYLAYMLAQTTNYAFMLIRFKSVNKRVRAQVNKHLVSILWTGTLSLPMIALLSFFVFIKAEPDGDFCKPTLPAFISILFIFSDTAFSCIGLYLFLKPLWILKRIHRYRGIAALQNREKKVITSGCFSVFIKVTSTFVFMLLLTHYTLKGDARGLVTKVWPVGPVDCFINTAAVGVAFGDFNFIINILRRKFGIVRTVLRGRSSKVLPDSPSCMQGRGQVDRSKTLSGMSGSRGMSESRGSNLDNRSRGLLVFASIKASVVEFSLRRGSGANPRESNAEDFLPSALPFRLKKTSATHDTG